MFTKFKSIAALAFLMASLSACQTITLSQSPDFSPRYDWQEISKAHGYNQMPVELFDEYGKPIMGETLKATLHGLNQAVLSSPIEFVSRKEAKSDFGSGLRLRLTNANYPILASKLCEGYNNGSARDVKSQFADTASPEAVNHVRLYLAYCSPNNILFTAPKAWVSTESRLTIAEGSSLETVLRKELYHSVVAMFPSYNPHQRQEACNPVSPDC